MYKKEEIQFDEIFVGNSSESDPELLKYERNNIEYRLGNIALDIHGKKLPKWYKPLFIKKKDFQKYDRLMMEELSKIRNS